MTTDLSVDERQARLRIRARQLTDPLGARGFRRTGARVNAERAARLAVAWATVVGFAGVTTWIAVTAGNSESDAAPAPIFQGVGPTAPVNTARFDRQDDERTAEANPVTVHKRTRSS
jgi:hypothetical protein